ncbi:MAG: TRAP transporter substrate-binding protein [Ahrensia sp.]|nr:TRAP transporter substrate-binding protein [Ahrensia sp.]
MKSVLKCLLASAVGVAAFSSIAQAETKVLTMSHWAGPKHAMATKVYPWFNEQLQACSNGTLSVKLENGLAPPPAQYDTVRDGVADLGWIVHGYTKGKFLTTKLAELPGLGANAETLSAAFQATHEKFFADAKEAKGVEVLANFVHGPGVINTKEKVTSYKQLEGMKLRVGGGVANQVGSALGVAGVNMPAPAVYEAISSGVAEGVFFPIETLHSFKINELTKYAFVNPDGTYTTSFAFILNQDSYEGLSDDHRACVDKVRGVDMARTIGRFWDEADQIGLEASKESGIELVEASAEERAYFKEKTAGIQAEVMKEVESRGVDATAALDFMKSQLK